MTYHNLLSVVMQRSPLEHSVDLSGWPESMFTLWIHPSMDPPLHSSQECSPSQEGNFGGNPLPAPEELCRGLKV